MSDLYIIAAGKGSRMGGSIPKALVPLAGQPNLTTTLQQIGHKFDNVFVVTNVEVQEPWLKYFKNLRKEFPELADMVTNIPITSGRGDGHAVMEALRVAEWMEDNDKVSLNDDIVIAWGDVFFPYGEIIDELLAAKIDMGVVPVVYEKNPYVSLRMGQGMQVHSADFSKFGETAENGYHDQSVFRFNRVKLHQTLQIMNAVLSKNQKYITSNGEMSLLHVFHFVSNTSQGPRPEIQAYETKYPTLSFNTVEEVAAIQQEINDKWQHKFRPAQF